MNSRWLYSILTLALVGTACGPDAPNPSGGGASSGPESLAPAATAAASGAAASVDAAKATVWEQTKDAARREGAVIVAGPAYPGVRAALTEEFQRATGIPVEYVSTSGSDVQTRVDRGVAAKNVGLDVTIGGVGTCWTFGEKGYVRDMGPLLLDPAVADGVAWRTGAPRLTKPTANMPADFHCGLQTAEYVMGDLFVNTRLVPPGTIQSWQDLLKPEYKGKIASFDPRRGGPGQSTTAYLGRVNGLDYLDQLYVGQGVVLSADKRQLAEWVARGTYPIGVALDHTAVESFRAQGLPIARVFPGGDPGLVTGGSSTIALLQDSPHPNAAVVFLNWFAGKSGQQAYEREMQEASLRADVVHSAPDYVQPKLGVVYPVDDNDPDHQVNYRLPANKRLMDALGR